jgi:predicted DsbA family dithiol-disulfide isomerase
VSGAARRHAHDVARVAAGAGQHAERRLDGIAAALRCVGNDMTTTNLKVEIWSDVACPWCYIGKRRFEAALERFPQRDQVEVEWKAFELDPGARADGADANGKGDGAHGGSAHYADRLGRKYGTSRAGAQQMLDTMTGAAATEGLDFHFEKAPAINTFDAHRVIHFALGKGVQDAVKERLLLAYFTEGEQVTDHEVLVRLAAEAGLDAADVREVLVSGRYADDVRTDEAEAAALGISGVPFFVVDRKYGVSGAQPAELLLEVLTRAWSERNPLTMVGATAAGAADGPACGPDGCAV